MEQVNAVVAAALRSQRAARGWSQADLGARLRWSQATVSAAEVGRKGFRIDEVFALAVVFEIPAIVLFRDAPHDIRNVLLGPTLVHRPGL